MSVRAHQKTGAGCVEGLSGLPGLAGAGAAAAAGCRKRDGEISGGAMPNCFTLATQLASSGNNCAGLIKVELEQLPLRVGGHRFGFPKLRDQQGVARHRHLDQFVADGHAMNVERRLAVKGQRKRKSLPGRSESPFFMRESKRPTGLCRW